MRNKTTRPPNPPDRVILVSIGTGCDMSIRSCELKMGGKSEGLDNVFTPEANKSCYQSSRREAREKLGRDCRVCPFVGKCARCGECARSCMA